MTYEQVRNNFVLNLAENAYLNMCTTEEMKLVISAIEKQIPKIAEHEDGVWSICPCCGGSVCNDTEHAVNREDHIANIVDRLLIGKIVCFIDT